MNEYSKKWWFWGLAGSVLVPVVLLSIDGWLNHNVAVEVYQPYIDGLCLALAGGVGAVSVPTLPVWPWARIVLFFLYIPLFICAVRAFAPWVPLV